MTIDSSSQPQHRQNIFKLEGEWAHQKYYNVVLGFPFTSEALPSCHMAWLLSYPQCLTVTFKPLLRTAHFMIEESPDATLKCSRVNVMRHKVSAHAHKTFNLVVIIQYNAQTQCKSRKCHYTDQSPKFNPSGLHKLLIQACLSQPQQNIITTNLYLWISIWSVSKHTCRPTFQIHIYVHIKGRCTFWIL